MISILKSKKGHKISFSKDFEIGQDPLPTIEKELVAGYVCQKCKQVILAYFKTDEFVPVWLYDELEDDRKAADNQYLSKKDMSDLRYRVFYAGCGMQGIELKSDEHNRDYSYSYNYSYRSRYSSYGDEKKTCRYKIKQIYNLVESANFLISLLQNKISDIDSDDKFTLPKVPENFDQNILIKNLKQLKLIDLIPEVCRNMPPLIHYDNELIEHENISRYDLNHGEGNDKRKAQKKYKNLKEKYLFIANSLIQE